MKSCRIAALSAALVLGVTACVGGSESLADRTIVLHGLGDPGSLDPHASTGSFSRSLTRFAYDTLVADGEDGTIQPQLAESWDVTPTRATFTLKQGILCDDGSELTVHDVAANFERLKDPEAAIPFTASFLGSAEYEVSIDEDAREITLDLPEPFSPLLSNLAVYPGIVCAEGLESPDRMAAETFGTGPFTLSDAQAGRTYTFEAREGYDWGPGGASTDADGFPSEVQIRIVDNETTAANLMLSDDLDLGIFQTRGAYERLQSDQFDEQTVPASSTYVHFNFLDEDSPIQDIAVRSALVKLLDREAMSNVATGDAEQLAISTALPQAPCHKDIRTDTLTEYAPESAVADLEGAGWTKDGDVWVKDGEQLQINLLVSGMSGPNRPVADYVLDAWETEGIAVTVENTDQPTSVDRRAEGTYDVWVGAWGNVFNHAVIAPMLMSENSPNYSYLANSEFNSIATEAFATDPFEACALWADAQDAINTDVSMVPMYYDATRWISRDGLSLEAYRSYVDPASLRVE